MRLRWPDAGANKPAILLAVGALVLDRSPHIAVRTVWWNTVCRDAFVYRWQDRPLPQQAQRHYDQLIKLQRSKPVRWVRHVRFDRLARVADKPLDLVNIGPGLRLANDLGVAVAVDACLAGRPAQALAWSSQADAALSVDLAAAVGSSGFPEIAGTRAEAAAMVSAWGPGAKGIVSIREPTFAHHRVINAICGPNGERFLDYSGTNRSTLAGGLKRVCDAENAAERVLARIDPSSGFASIHLWRGRDLPNSLDLPDNLFDRSVADRRYAIARILPDAMAVELQALVADRVEAARDLSYARWLIRQVQRGACTVAPEDYQALVAGRLSFVALTRHDSALKHLVENGRALLGGTTVETTVSDTECNRSLAALFSGALVRRGAIDGLPAGYFEIQLSHTARQRSYEQDTRYEPPLDDLDPSCPVGVPRNWSWIETNRVVSPGTRRTNCWNTAAGVANYLAGGGLSSSLPIYADAPFRPTITEFLALVHARGPTSFVANIAEARAIAESWGPGRHGVVAAALNQHSTHMFNVVNDGALVRFIDGHSGMPGDFNFETKWMRIGVAEIGRIDSRFLADQ